MDIYVYPYPVWIYSQILQPRVHLIRVLHGLFKWNCAFNDSIAVARQFVPEVSIVLLIAIDAHATQTVQIGVYGGLFGDGCGCGHFDDYILSMILPI